MGRRPLGLGEAGEIEAVPQHKVEGRWVKSTVRGAERWRARCYYRSTDGIRRDLARFASTKREAMTALEQALEQLGSTDTHLTPSTPLAHAGVLWLEQVGRRDSRRAASTVKTYGEMWERHVVAAGSSLRGLTLAQANDPQRLRGFLHQLADSAGTGAARTCKSILSGVLQMAVDNGVQQMNAMRQVRPVQAQQERASLRDHRRALTRDERAALMTSADTLAELAGHGRSKRKWQSAADLLAFMAGTGVRIGEAAALRWEHVDLDAGRVRLHGTKSKSARRALNLPGWLVERLQRRGPGEGLVFPSPARLDPETPWDRRNLNRTVREIFDAAGMEWAVPHSLRRTTASLLEEAGVPLSRIADQLGHADASQTMRTYLGRDFEGDKSELAGVL